MRTDKSVDRVSFRQSSQWKTDQFENIRTPEIDRRLEGAEEIDGQLFVHSLSGKERNHLFLNLSGEQFDDISLVSGLDNIADSRGFATLDYDRDGLQDIALVNANTPLLNLYHNNLADTRLSTPQNFIALRFVGGNQSNSPQPKTACRDGYGAMVEVSISDGPVIKREHRCGEGYGAQNSATMIIGIGAAAAAEKIKVRWPSGISHEIENVQAKSLVTTFERKEHSDTQTHFSISNYEPIQIAEQKTSISPSKKFEIEGVGDETKVQVENAKLKVYVTMATWCPSCLKHIPDLKVLSESLSANEIELIGLPIDPNDDEAKLKKYVDEHKPAYRLQLQLSPQDRKTISGAMSNITPFDALPATFITDSNGALILGTAGTPTVSQLKRLLAGH